MYEMPALSTHSMEKASASGELNHLDPLPVLVPGPQKRFPDPLDFGSLVANTLHCPVVINKYTKVVILDNVNVQFTISGFHNVCNA